MDSRSREVAVIGTVEGVRFALPLAGPIHRFLAWLVDAALVGAALLLAGALLTALSALSPDLSWGITILVQFVLSTGYAMALEWGWRGQTVGKRLLGIRVIDRRGLRLTPDQVFIRNLLRAVDSFPLFYLVGGAACFFSPKAQRLGDLAANTIVVRNARAGFPDLDRLLPGRFNSLLAVPHLAARLRQKVTPAEASIALRALLRREQLLPAARVELFRELAGRFRAVVHYPPEAVEGIGDERYVADVVEVIFRPGKTGGSAPRG